MRWINMSYECECIECGHKETSESHCADIKCSECGGQMRRQGRPGAGKAEVNMVYNDIRE